MANSLIDVGINSANEKILPVSNLQVIPIRAQHRRELTFPASLPVVDPREADLAVPFDGILADTANVQIDVKDMQDQFGDDVDMATVRTVVISNRSDAPTLMSSSTAGALTLTGSLLNAFFGASVSIPLGPGDVLAITNIGQGVETVPPLAAPNLQIANNSGVDAEYWAVLYGGSAVQP